MARRKRASSSVRKIVTETKKGDTIVVIKDTSNRRSSICTSKVVSSEKKHKAREDNDAVLSGIEDNVQFFVEDLLESAEDSEVKEQIPVRSKRIHNKQSDVNNSLKATKEWKRYGYKALREIQKYQRSTELLIPRAGFSRVCRDIFYECGNPELRIAKTALECLQEAAEVYLTQLFEDAYLCTLHASRKTLMNKDIRLARRIGGRNGFYV